MDDHKPDSRSSSTPPSPPANAVGRDMDVRVSEDFLHRLDIGPAETERHSTELDAAFVVIEKLREDGWMIDIRIDDEPWDEIQRGVYTITLLGCNKGRVDTTEIRAEAETLPHAICLAALQVAVPVEEGE